MTFSLPTQITSEADVYDFFRYVYFVENTSFHPDDSFSEYIDYFTKERAFDDEKCKLYDKLMSQAHEICKKNDPGRIYDIAMEIDETSEIIPGND